MGLNAKVGSFTCTTAAIGNTQAITGLGFQPKALIVWSNQRTDVVDAIGNGNSRGCIGIGVSSTDRRCINVIMQDAQGTSVSKRGQRDDALFATVSSAPAWAGLMDLQSMDSDGFTLVVDGAFAQPIQVFYLALGGDTITGVETDSFLGGTATGNRNVTTIAFTPTALLFLAAMLSSVATGTSGTAVWSVGAATASGEQGVFAGLSEDGAGTSDTAHYAQHLECLANAFGSTTSIAGRESFVAFLSNGFTLNCLETTGTGLSAYVLALGGVTAKAGSLLTATSLTTVAVTGLGFRPKAVFFFSAGKVENTQDTPAADNQWTFGAYDGTTNRGMGVRDQDNLGTTDVVTVIGFADVYSNIANGSATLEGAMAGQSLDADGFTMVMTNADPTQRYVNYIAFGEAPGPTPNSLMLMGVGI